jgi:hypothetical protein
MLQLPGPAVPLFNTNGLVTVLVTRHVLPRGIVQLNPVLGILPMPRHSEGLRTETVVITSGSIHRWHRMPRTRDC